MSLEGEKQIMKQFSHLNGATADSGYTWTFQPQMAEGQGNWKVNHHGDSSWIWQQTYFDLAGFRPDELSTQLLAVAIQKPYEPVMWKGLFGDTSNWPSYLQLYVYLSDVPVLSDDVPSDIVAFADSAIAGTYPSFSTFESGEVGPPLAEDYQYAISWQNLLYAEQTMYTSNTTVDDIGLKMPLYTRLYGSGNATASDRIYCTLIWRVADYPAALEPMVTGQMYLPPIRIVAGIEVFKDNDTGYMDRLRRSYVEQQGFNNA